MKTAVITGGTKGIGRAIACEFAAGGYDLAICARTERDLEELEIDFKNAFPDTKVFTMVVDMRKKESVEAFARALNRQMESIDVLVNNAGVFLPGEISREPEGNLELQIETNLYSAYHLTRGLLPAMLRRGQGHIFNMCSIASIIAYPNGGSYSISKFALLGFSKVLREELKDKGIKVTAVLPGATWSASWAGVDLPESRLMQAADIAQSVWSASQLGPSAVVEEIIIRPQLGDL